MQDSFLLTAGVRLDVQCTARLPLLTSQRLHTTFTSNAFVKCSAALGCARGGPQIKTKSRQKRASGLKWPSCPPHSRKNAQTVWYHPSVRRARKHWRGWAGCDTWVFFFQAAFRKRENRCRERRPFPPTFPRFVAAFSALVSLRVCPQKRTPCNDGWYHTVCAFLRGVRGTAGPFGPTCANAFLLS